MTAIHADELQPGDVVYDGRNHQITRDDRRDGWARPRRRGRALIDVQGTAELTGRHQDLDLPYAVAVVRRG